MPPPVYPIAADELSTAAQLDAQGRRRKPEPGQKRVDLAACELLRMVQYRCEVQEPVTFESRWEGVYMVLFYMLMMATRKANDRGMDWRVM
ncbi:hypothetical protein S40285_04734 [Stachybotrys chlorohalonatus IBT 40285]|uniref:Uncharacterized protein n=1 Tax=Stachybotrys chlorohalonatus (strain IBT 40285) TaxID=1283841 RepID=A0A084Q9W4_STAC4|nr:hypothetical protein S40285_04734 [Stachybotrys chlorohalonata IBT 40285]